MKEKVQRQIITKRKIKMSLSTTPYDDVFRTLLNDCSRLILPVINEVFGEQYTGKEEIVFSPNEHFLNQQDGKEQERITDSSFKVIGLAARKYHYECQSGADNSMLVRLFEYDSQIALDEGEIKGNVLTVTFPHTAVLFLRCNKDTPDKMKVVIKTPRTDAEYEIPVVKIQNYTINDIFEKGLLFFIPFYIFTHESRFEKYNKSAEERKILQEEYEFIKNKLEELMNQGVIDEYTKCTIIDMSNKVLEHIAVKYDKVREEVKAAMGGRVLDYEAKTIRNEGRLQMLFELVQDNLLSVKDAASRAKLTEEAFSEKMRSYRDQ